MCPSDACPSDASKTGWSEALSICSPPANASNSDNSAESSSSARASSSGLKSWSSTSFLGGFVCFVGCTNASWFISAIISSCSRSSACWSMPPVLAVEELLWEPPARNEGLKIIACGTVGRGSPRFTGWLCFCRSLSSFSCARRSARLSASAASSSSSPSRAGASSSSSGMEISTSFTGAGRLLRAVSICILCCALRSFSGIPMSSSPWFKASPSRKATLPAALGAALPATLAGVPGGAPLCPRPDAGVRPPGVAPPGVAPPGVAPGVAPGVMPERACSA
mmetsp:Transcript_84024/g.234674  ORF Transcript_84024/g.234674 Transcript_84024/m.234674 type:complete len:280 (+) Transcript_84024:570-1409(+)